MAELEMVDIINDKFYMGLPQTSSNCKLQIYNLQTHQLIATTLFEFTYFDNHWKVRPYYISGEHIIFSTPRAIKTYKIEERTASERKNKYATLITNLADEYSLAMNLEQEIRKHFSKELQDYLPFEVINYDAHDTLT